MTTHGKYCDFDFYVTSLDAENGCALHTTLDTTIQYVLRTCASGSGFGVL